MGGHPHTLQNNSNHRNIGTPALLLCGSPRSWIPNPMYYCRRLASPGLPVGPLLQRRWWVSVLFYCGNSLNRHPDFKSLDKQINRPFPRLFTTACSELAMPSLVLVGWRLVLICGRGKRNRSGCRLRSLNRAPVNGCTSGYLFQKYITVHDE